MDLSSLPANSWLGVLGSFEDAGVWKQLQIFVSGRPLRPQGSDHTARLGAKQPAFLSDSDAIRQSDLGLPPSCSPSSTGSVASGPSLPFSFSARTAEQIQSPTTFQGPAHPVV